MGITLGELSAQTCDSKWMPGYVPLADSAVAAFKLVELQGAALYWDTSAEMFGRLSMDELAVSVYSSLCVILLHFSEVITSLKVVKSIV